MNYIFLDVDGVLNNQKHYKKQHKKYGGRFFCENMPFNPRSLKNLKKIIDKTGGKTETKVVVTSSWRRSERAMAVLEARLAEYGIKIFGKTEHMDGKRGLEIWNWLENNASKERLYMYCDGLEYIVPDYNIIILDDKLYDIESFFDSMSITHTDQRVGLNIVKTYEAIDKLLWQKNICKTCTIKEEK